MTLWIVLTSLVAVCAVVLTVPLVRRWQTQDDPEAETLIALRDQLADIGAQERGGVVGAGEADALRTEVKRRILVEGPARTAPARPLGTGALGRIAAGTAIAVALGGTLLYAKLGSPGVPDAGTVAPQADANTPAGSSVAATTAPQPDAQPDMGQLVAKIEARTRANPGDAQAWRMLGLARYAMQQYRPAADAYARAATLAPGRADVQSGLGEALALADDGTVTPTAQAAFRRALVADPADPRARFYLGVARDQAGDRKGAIDAWVALLNSAPPGAPWLPQVRQTLARVAEQAHIDLTGRLKDAVPPPAPPPEGAPAPSPDQVAAVQTMAPRDQQAMIKGMVARLADRLKTNPQDAQGWLRLIRARMVLGDATGAARARSDALAAIVNASDRQTVIEGARALAVPGA